MNDFIAKPFVEGDMVAVFNKWINDTNDDDIQVFDISKLYTYLGEDSADSEIVTEVIQATVTELEKENERLLTDAKEGFDVQYLKRIGHKLYGTARTVGLDQLAIITHELDILPLDAKISDEELTEKLQKLITDISNAVAAVRIHL